MTPLRPFPYLLESHFGVLLPHLPLTADLARPLSTSAFCTDLNRNLAFAKDHEPELAPVGGGRDFQAKIETKLRALETNSGAQEAAIASLPDNTRAFCEAKGRLYYIIKDIINAARALHASEPEAAAKYNLKVLYRRGGKWKPEVLPPVPAPGLAK